jgi:hypothetical protein
MISEQQSDKAVEDSSYGLIMGTVLTVCFLMRLRKTENPQDRQCPSKDLNWLPSKYKSEVLILELVLFHTISVLMKGE